MEKLIWIPALIFLLGLLVCFHELGHFTMAKLLGIRVEEFAFGFGPKWIVLARRGGTEYTIHPFPLGGFVKLAGEDMTQENVPDGFYTKPWWVRFLVYSAGPFMSLLLAYIVFCVMGFTVGLPIGNKVMNKVDLVQPGGVAQKAGLKVGDVIIAINNKPITNAKQMLDTIHGSGEKTLLIAVERGNDILHITATPQTKAVIFESMGFQASRLEKDADLYRIDNVKRHSPAAKAGLRVNDRIISINGRKTDSGREMVEIVRSAGGKPVNIVLERGDNLIKKTIIPDPKKLAKDMPVAYLGFILKQKLDRVGVVESIKYGNETTVMFIKTMITVIFSKDVKDAVGGPLAIASETQNSVKRGVSGYLELMAALSLSLGVLNLFPIPVMDGGQMVLVLVEGLKRKRLSQRTWEVAQLIGLAMLGLIFVLVMTLDLGRVMNGTMFR